MTEQDLQNIEVAAQIYPTEFGVYRVEHWKGGASILFKSFDSNKEYHLYGRFDNLNFLDHQILPRIIEHHESIQSERGKGIITYIVEFSNRENEEFDIVFYKDGERYKVMSGVGYQKSYELLMAYKKFNEGTR